MDGEEIGRLQDLRTEPSLWNEVAAVTAATLAFGSAAARTCTPTAVYAGARPGLATVTTKRYGRPRADGRSAPSAMVMDGDGGRRRGGPSAVAQGSASKVQLHV